MPRRLFLSSLLIAGTAGCTTLRPVNPREYLATPRPEGIQVVSANGSTFLMQNPQLIGDDTLVGEVQGGALRLPLSDVRTVRASRPAPVRTSLLIGSSAVLLSIVAWTERPNSDTCMTPAGPLLCSHVHGP